MKSKDIQNLISTFSKSKKQDPKYSAYAVIEKLEYSNSELKEAVDVIHEILFESTQSEAYEKFLFEKGWNTAYEKFLSAREGYKDFSQEDKHKFESLQEKFEKKAKAIEPALILILKLKEVLSNE